MISPAQWLGQDTDHLIEVQPPHKLEADTGAHFQQMHRAAARQGIDITIASSHRDFSRQLSIWNQKWLGQKALYSLQGEILNTDELSAQQKLEAILTWSALPGASRHHWGTDLDVYDQLGTKQCAKPLQLVPQEYAPSGPCYRLAMWLEEHGEKYGFYQPYSVYTGGVAVEPWHISYRPMAEIIEQHLTMADLRMAIEQADIQGKSCILTNLELIFQKYTLNKGTQ